jgi:hypothetical protein
VRVLVTNSFHLTAYPLVRALRPRAQFVAVGYLGARPGDVALSRYADAGRPLALPRLVPKGVVLEANHNSELERGYLDRLLEICRELRIDVVVPTSDHEVLVLAKNKAGLAERGITALAPDIGALRRIQDKLAAVWTAQACGLPTPRTLEVSPGQVADAAEELGLPVVVKARFSYGGFGVRIAHTREAATAAFTELARWSGDPFLQELVPGAREPSVNAVVTSEGETPIVFTLRKLRHVHTSLSTAVRVVPDVPEAAAVCAVLARTGMVGFVAAQLKQDARDGVHRLIELNPRFGANFRIVAAMAERSGVDLVGAMLDAHRGRPVPAGHLALGQIGVSVLEDLVSVRTRRRAARAGRPGVPRALPWLARVVGQQLSRGVVRDVFWQEKLRDWRAVLSSYRRTFAHDLNGDVELVSFGDWQG